MSPLFYPSFQALRLADVIFQTIADQVAGYAGRMGAAWYWRMPGGVLITFRLDYTVTEERWDVVRGQATSPRAGLFSAADFPFIAYSTSPTTVPFIHDMQGIAQWSNRLYFNMGHLIRETIGWLQTLHAALIAPQVAHPSTFPLLDALERELVAHAMEHLDGVFVLSRLHETFGERISRRRLSRLAQDWESMGLLTAPPRRVTYALRVLAKENGT